MAQYSSKEVGDESYYVVGDNSENMKREVKAKTPTYKHAKKVSMGYGDAGTYFMRKTDGKHKKRRAVKR